MILSNSTNRSKNIQPRKKKPLKCPLEVAIKKNIYITDKSLYIHVPSDTIFASFSIYRMRLLV